MYIFLLLFLVIVLLCYYKSNENTINEYFLSNNDTVYYKLDNNTNICNNNITPYVKATITSINNDELNLKNENILCGNIIHPINRGSLSPTTNTKIYNVSNNYDNFNEIENDNNNTVFNSYNKYIKTYNGIDNINSNLIRDISDNPFDKLVSELVLDKLGDDAKKFRDNLNLLNNEVSQNGRYNVNYNAIVNSLSQIREDQTFKKDVNNALGTVEKDLQNLIDTNAMNAMTNLINTKTNSQEFNNNVNKNLTKVINDKINTLDVNVLLINLQDSIKKNIDKKKETMDIFDLSNYPGVLMRNYNNNGVLQNQRIIPVINYINLVSDNTNLYRNVRFIEMFGLIYINPDTYLVEFQLDSSLASKFFFGVELLVDEFTNNNTAFSTKNKTRVLYVQPNSYIPYKILLRLDNSPIDQISIILSWKLNNQGLYKVLDSKNYFLPDLAYD